MEHELEKLQLAKMYMDYLANGIDPISNTDAASDTLHHEQIVACFRYISDILAWNISEAEKTKRRASAFYITDIQCAELNVCQNLCKVSELADEINRVTASNRTKKLSAAWINDWLESAGYLCKSDLKSRIATDQGKQIGISSEYRRMDNGREYYINYYTEQAQRFVFDHIKEIVAFRDEQYSHIADNIQSIDYPKELSVREFIRQNADKCFIMSVGSCDSVAKVGSYIAVLLYKGISKALKKVNIPTASANVCILMGIQDAASAIKMPTDVIILSSCTLGFHTPKSPNYQYCQEIYQILADKQCSVALSVCKGKKYEFNNFVKSFASKSSSI